MTDRDQHSRWRHVPIGRPAQRIVPDEIVIQESVEARIRRCLHRAGALVTKAAADPGRELLHLGGARSWSAAALKGIERLASVAENRDAARDTLPLKLHDQRDAPTGKRTEE